MSGTPLSFHKVSEGCGCLVTMVMVTMVTMVCCKGDLLQLGESSVLRFNHPHQAEKLRKKHNVSSKA